MPPPGNNDATAKMMMAAVWVLSMSYGPAPSSGMSHFILTLRGTVPILQVKELVQGQGASEWQMLIAGYPCRRAALSGRQVRTDEKSPTFLVTLLF